MVMPESESESDFDSDSDSKSDADFDDALVCARRAYTLAKSVSMYASMLRTSRRSVSSKNSRLLFAAGKALHQARMGAFAFANANC